MERQPVESSVIGAVGYTHVLEVQFQSGRVYQYYDVPEEVFRGMLNADSKGKYFNSHIRGKYNYREIEVKSSGKQDEAVNV